MKKQILFPTDFSEPSVNAFRTALAMANKMQACIHLLHVVVPEVEPLDVPVLSAKATQKRVEMAREVAQSFEDTGIASLEKPLKCKIQKILDVGFPGRVIISTAKNLNVDFIVICSHGEGHALDKLLGSVTSFVIEKSSCPVLVLPEIPVDPNISTILYATDYQETDPYHMFKVVNLLKPYSEVLRCIHVKTSPKPEHKPVDMEKLKEFFKNQSPALQISFHEWEASNIEKGLKEFSEIYEVDLMVLLAQKRSYLDKILHKSTSKNIAMHSGIPVLIMKEH